jgi:hypothetical protein
MQRTIGLALMATLWSSANVDAQNKREQQVRDDLSRITEQDFWIYNDVEAGFAEARKTGKPVLVTFRCIPCEACAQLDEDVAERDPRIRDLLDKFVCVRVVTANGLDLSLFQYDYDQSWAAFILNADRTIYGRYGTRSHQTESDDDVSVEGFAKSLEAALALHADYPANKESLAAKRGPDADIPVPEELPTLNATGKYGPKLNYDGNVVQSCIHCHMVGDAQRAVYRQKNEPLPDRLMYPYPNPKQFGLILDPKEAATVLRVERGSTAARDGFRPGDQIVSLGDQPIISTADIQWVLHNAGESGRLTACVRRDGREVDLPLTLEEGWRREGDISWRVSSWSMRRIALGGLSLAEATPEERRRAKVDDAQLALRVKAVGQYGAHAAAKNAGFQKDDVIISFDGRTERMTEGQLFEYVLKNKRTGDKMAVVVLRGNDRKSLTMPVQE